MSQHLEHHHFFTLEPHKIATQVPLGLCLSRLPFAYHGDLQDDLATLHEDFPHSP